MILTLVFIFLFGLIIGSFLNCLTWRLYKEETILGRSYCPKCRVNINWYDNIPVLSFLFLKRKCRSCHSKISWQYPLVEIITAVLFVLIFYFNFSHDFSIINLFYDLFLVSLLIIIFVFDWRWFLIPTQVLFFGGLLFFFINIFLGFSIWFLLLNMIIGVSFFFLQYFLTRRKGIGEGDIWLGGFLGLAFPIFGHFALLIFLTYIIGGLVSIILIIFGLKKIGSKLPLGIFLSASALISIFWADKLVSWYLGLVLG